MAHHHSAKKKIRQDEVRRLRNRYYAVTMRNAVRKIRATKEKEEAEKALPGVVKMIDKLAGGKADAFVHSIVNSAVGFGYEGRNIFFVTVENVDSAIGASAVHHYVFYVAIRLIYNTFNGIFYKCRAVVNHRYNRYFWIVHNYFSWYNSKN